MTKKIKKKNLSHLRRSILIAFLSLITLTLGVNAALAYVSEPPGDDGIPPASDNCPTVVNPEQRNTDFVPPAPDYKIMSIALMGNPPTDTINATPASFMRDDEDNGNYTATNMTLDCNPCMNATFPGITFFGGGGAFCGYSSQVPENLALNNEVFCGYDPTADEYYEFEFLTHNRWGTCIGDPTDCTNAGDFSSYNRFEYTEDALGNACDCASDGFCTADEWCDDQATPDPDCGVKVVPDDITDLVASDGEMTVSLTWSEPGDNLGPIYGYRVEYGTVASGTFGSTCVDSTCTDVTPGATISGLDNGTTYQFRVYALNDNGESENPSNVDTATSSHIRQWPNPTTPSNIEISSNANRHYYTKGIYTTDSTYIATWTDDNPSLSNDEQIYAQKLDITSGGTFGTGSWVSGGIEVSEAVGYDIPYSNIYDVVSDGAGGVIVVWSAGTAFNTASVYAQRIDSNGDRQWFVSTPCTHNVNCSNIVLSSAPSYMSLVDAIPDGSGGAFISWNDYYGTINVSRIDSSGNILWGPVAAPTFNAKAYGTMVSDDSGGVIVSLYGRLLATDPYSLFIYKIQGDGTIGTPLNPTDNWPDAGNPAIEVTDNTYACTRYHDLADGSGGLYLTCDYYNDVGRSIRAYHVDSDGFVDTGGNWNGTSGLFLSAGYTYNADLVSDGAGGLIYGFSNGSTGTTHIDSLSSTGTRPWGNGSPNLIYTGSDIDSINGLSADGSGGAYIAMSNFDGNMAIFQRVDNTGTTLYPYSGSNIGYIVGGETSDYLAYHGVYAGGSALVLWGKADPITSNYDIYGQYFKESTSPCATVGAGEFCGTQIISSSTLTFQDIPDTINFGTITAGSNQDLFNNDTPPHANEPTTDDLLSVYDDRDSGGFEVTIDTEGTFTDGTYTIPLTDLYIITSLEETPAGGDVNATGVTYKSGFTGTPDAVTVQNISAPVYVDVDTESLTDTATYTGLGASAQFGGSPLVLMDGVLSSAQGRNGEMTQYANFYLHLGATQADGNYSLVLTYTLTDSTT